MSVDLPESHADLLERPLFAHLATIRPDGSPQISVMWFAWDRPNPHSPDSRAPKEDHFARDSCMRTNRHFGGSPEVRAAGYLGPPARP